MRATTSSRCTRATEACRCTRTFIAARVRAPSQKPPYAGAGGWRRSCGPHRGWGGQGGCTVATASAGLHLTVCEGRKPCAKELSYGPSIESSAPDRSDLTGEVPWRELGGGFQGAPVMLCSLICVLVPRMCSNCTFTTYDLYMFLYASTFITSILTRFLKLVLHC